MVTREQRARQRCLIGKLTPLVGDFQELQRQQFLVVNQVIKGAFERLSVVCVWRLQILTLGTLVILGLKGVFYLCKTQFRVGRLVLVDL